MILGKKTYRKCLFFIFQLLMMPCLSSATQLPEASSVGAGAGAPTPAQTPLAASEKDNKAAAPAKKEKKKVTLEERRRERAERDQKAIGLLQKSQANAKAKLAASGISGKVNEQVALPANVTVNKTIYIQGKPSHGSGVISYWFKQDGDQTTHHFTIGQRLDNIFTFHITEKNKGQQHQYEYDIKSGSLKPDNDHWHNEALEFVKQLKFPN